MYRYGYITIPMDAIIVLWAAYQFNYCPKVWNENSWNEVSGDEFGAYNPCSTKPAECEDSQETPKNMSKFPTFLSILDLETS